ncbi:MAG: PqqD family protein [Actinomycetes bacterium]
MARSVRIVRAPAVLWRSGPFGRVILAPGDAEPRACSGTAAAVWDALAEPVTLEELAADLAEAFVTDVATVTADLGPLIDGWRASGAVVDA